MAEREPDRLQIAYERSGDRRPRAKLWVFVVLIFAWFSGIIAGMNAWRFVVHRSHDPLLELRYCMPYSVAIGIGLSALYHRRMWRLTTVATLVGLGLGGATGVSAVVWHVMIH